MKIPKIIHESWHEYLQPLFDEPKMGMIIETINAAPFHPKKADVFRVFSMPIDQIKVVILGQDPYPNGEATGLAFGVRPDKNTPTSLKIIKNEVMNTLYDKNHDTMFSTVSYPSLVEWKTLEHWHNQGVFLLNTALTVKDKSAGSHLMIWQWFTRRVIDIISKQCCPVWLLWGAKAQGYMSYIDHHIVMDEDKIDVVSPANGILIAAHPAAEAYDPDRTPRFTGCNHFSLCNKILKIKGQEPIKW